MSSTTEEIVMLGWKVDLPMPGRSKAMRDMLASSAASWRAPPSM